MRLAKEDVVTRHAKWLYLMTYAKVRSIFNYKRYNTNTINHKYDKENVSTKYSSLQGLNQNVIQMHYLEQYLANAIIWKTARHFGDLWQFKWEENPMTKGIVFMELTICIKLELTTIFWIPQLNVRIQVCNKINRCSHEKFEARVSVTSYSVIIISSRIWNRRRFDRGSNTGNLWRL